MIADPVAALFAWLPAALACMPMAWPLVAWIRAGLGRRAQWHPSRRRSAIQPALAGAGWGHRKPDWVIRHLVLLKAHMPEAGCRRIADDFNRLFAHQGVWVSKSLVHRALVRHAAEVAQARRAMRSTLARQVAADACWGLDLTGRADATGQVHTILGLLDHGSRLALRLARIPRKCAWTLLGHLCLAIAQWRKPAAVRTDNERCFTGRVFTTALRLMRIRHQRTRLHCPWQNGRIERLFGALKWTLKPVVLIDGPMPDRFLGDFACWYNELRPHQALGGATPKQARQGLDPWYAPQPPKQVLFVEGWTGRMSGLIVRR